jgi:hypothetical protein
MVWGFCYLRIFKKMHSISGRSSTYCYDLNFPPNRISRVLYWDIFLTLNIVHTYSLCSILKNTDQCIVSCYVTNYTEHQRF